MKKIYDCIADGNVSLRNAAIVIVGLSCGIRACDLIKLQLSDIDWNNETIQFKQSKTGNGVCIPLTKRVGNALFRYIIEERPKIDSKYLFLSSFAPYAPFADHAVCLSIVNKVFKIAGIDNDNRISGMHMLRHNAASTMVKNEVPIETIAAILGHAAPDTTDIYITTDIKDLRSVFSLWMVYPGRCTMNDFTSNLKPLIEDFLEFKHALGIKYDTGRFYLEQLDKYNKCHSNAAVLTRDLAEGWANQQAEKSITADRSWISAIREFGRYLYSIGYEEAYILDEGYVVILQSKAHSDRRLYLSDELIDYLKRYDAAISPCFPDREYFFPGGAGGICSTNALSANFRNIWLSAGLKRDGKVKPRAYDFRHHFACANIMKWSDEGKDIHAMLPYDYMPITRNLSDKSVEAYKQSLKVYLEFLASEKGIVNEKVNFDSFTRDNIKEFIVWLTGKNCSAKIINLRLTAIRAFLKYSSEEDFELRGVYTDVCSIKKVKEEKKPIVYLQPEAAAAILAAYDTATAKQRRNRMMLIILYDTGARVQELADMNNSSLHLREKNPFVTLIGKGRKSRNVPLLNKTVQHMNEYLKEYHPEINECSLFYSLLDGKSHILSTDSISLVLKSVADKAKGTCVSVPERMHCHMIRKTKAMDLHKNGVPLPFIMQLLGNESMSTTSGFYAFATLKMMSDAMNKAAPILDKEEKLWKKDDVKKLLYSLD